MINLKLMAVSTLPAIAVGLILGSQQPKPAHAWMNELQKQHDPNASLIPHYVVSLSCTRLTYQPIAPTPATQGLEYYNDKPYAYAEFDIDLITGQLKPIGEPILPAADFKCPTGDNK